MVLLVKIAHTNRLASASHGKLSLARAPLRRCCGSIILQNDHFRRPLTACVAPNVCAAVMGTAQQQAGSGGPIQSRHGLVMLSQHVQELPLPCLVACGHLVYMDLSPTDAHKGTHTHTHTHSQYAFGARGF